MENKDQSELRHDDSAERDRDHERDSTPRSSRNDTRDDENRRSDATDQRDQKSSNETTDIVDLEEYIQDADGHRRTALYRRATADFDPTETRVQLAEHWNCSDPELDEYGHF